MAPQPNNIRDATQLARKKAISYQGLSRLRTARSKEFSLQSIYKYGYRNKEDVSNLPANTLVVGSQNVLTNAAEQVAIRNGYQYDGAAGNQNTYGIDSGYDFNTHSDGIRNIRKWGTNLETRYVNPLTKAVSWINILSTLSAGNVANFTSFWNNSLSKNDCLFVNGNFNVYRWTGGVGSFASSTSNSITLSGNKTLNQLNFDPTGSLLIDGVTYNYTSAGLLVANTYSQNPTNNTPGVSTTQWNSQLFTTGASASQILTVTPTIATSTASVFSAIFQGSLYTDNAGVPGTLVATTQAVIGPIGIANVNPIFVFNQTINPATNYHFVISVVQVGQTLTFQSPYGANIYAPVTYTIFTGNSGAVGTNISTNSGVTWSPQNGYLNMVVVENDSSLQTFNGVTPNPSGISIGDAVIQLPTVGATLIAGMTLPTIDLIGTLRNQIYYGSFTSNTVYITKVNSFNDTTFSTPRVVGEGALANLDAPPIAFITQDESMYISAGLKYWYLTQFTLSADLSKESFEINLLKTSGNQGAISQGLTSKFKNSIIYVSSEDIFNALGSVKNILADPQVTNMSDPIRNDMDAYNFTGGFTAYNKYFVYFSVPTVGVVRMFNVEKKYWEAPQLIPASCFYEVDGAIYAHSSLTNESYQLFVPDTYNDLGNPITSAIAFPYVSQAGGSAPEKKNFNKHYTEGYISSNTSIIFTVNYDFGGFSGTYSTIISGADPKIIFNKITDGSIGQNPLGSEPIGQILNLSQQPPIPKFRVINTFPRINCYEYQIVYSSDDVDFNYALLRFGPGISSSTDIATEITE